MVENSNTSYENEIHLVDSASNKDSKIYLFVREVLISREERLKKIKGKWPKTEKSIGIQINRSISIGTTGLYSLISKSLHYFGFLTPKIKLIAKN